MAVGHFDRTVHAPQIERQLAQGKLKALLNCRQTFVFVTGVEEPRINQSNGGLSESAWISRGKLVPAQRRSFQSQWDSVVLNEMIASVSSVRLENLFAIWVIKMCTYAIYIKYH